MFIYKSNQKLYMPGIISLYKVASNRNPTIDDGKGCLDF